MHDFCIDNSCKRDKFSGVSELVRGPIMITHVTTQPSRISGRQSGSGSGGAAAARALLRMKRTRDGQLGGGTMADRHGDTSYRLLKVADMWTVTKVREGKHVNKVK